MRMTINYNMMVSRFFLLTLIFLASCTVEDMDNEVVIFTSRQPQLIEDLLTKFTAETGIKVIVLSGNAQQLMERIVIEGSSTEADILMTVDAGVLWQAAMNNIFQPVESAILDSRIPMHLKDENNLWFGFSKRARTIVVNKDIFIEGSSGPSLTYEDLAAPLFDWEFPGLCLRTSKKVYNQSLIASMIDSLGIEETTEIVRGWVKNLQGRQVYTSDTNVLKAVNSGACGMTIVNTYYLARLVEKGEAENLRLLWANQYDRGVHVNISGAGLIKWSKNQTSAIKLLEWLSSEYAQNLYARENMEYPVVPGVDIHPILQEWGNFKEDLIQVDKLGLLQEQAVFIAQQAGYN